MKNEDSVPVCQIVGHKNTGKTTLMRNLVEYYDRVKGFQVGALKHHGHGGEPDMVKGTDSHRHFQAGATISAVQGETIMQMAFNPKQTWDLETIVTFYQQFPLDLILVEGYKKAAYPKIVVIKDEEEMEWSKTLSNVIAVTSQNDLLLDQIQQQTFLLDEKANYLPQLADWIMENVGMER
ncbi:molybdopterin-guanine dinucleotide biosynthesis protein B [Oceanobacillus halotolerans]|uniref:molybdopterin-guanine dinucleotide biosynthesis protein B n=1 Tax=Oceanobacillus halotolerans TaxID=2663380 RepID=UPI0013DBF954|nr:molybdopterin-guanine dinucleotide biosynthesis protein B [Oceanobacillus halotolerans]